MLAMRMSANNKGQLTFIANLQYVYTNLYGGEYSSKKRKIIQNKYGCALNISSENEREEQK